MGKLKFIDNLNVGKLHIYSDSLSFFKDMSSSGRPSLNVKIRATNSGYLLNRRVYPGTFMKEGTDSWIKPYKRPVLINHNEDSGDPIGRVVGANYTQLKNGNEFVNDYVNPASGEDLGSGFITLDLCITDKEAIEKILDGRYDTVSTAHHTDAAICSICGFNYLSKKGDAEEMYCEHVPGRTYEIDGKDMDAYLINGRIKYIEVSYVNVPAQPNTKTLSVVHNSIDSLIKEGKPIESFSKTSLTSMSLRDAEGDSIDLILREGQKDSIPDKATRMLSKKVFTGTSNTSVEENNMKNKKKGASDAATSIVASMMADLEATNATETKEATVEPKEGDKPTDKTDEVVLDQASDEDTALFNIAHSLIECNLLEDGEVECEFTADKVKELAANFDAKLSTEKRNKLKSGSFCGPDRSFPVPDCAHVTAARRLIGRAKLSSDQKKKVLSCVANKAKSLGCGGQDAFIAEHANESCEAPVCKTTPADSKKQETPVHEIIANLVKEKDNLADQNRRLQSALDSKTQLCTDLGNEVTKVKADQIKETARQLAIIRINLGKPGATDIDTKDKFEALVDKLCKRSITSLRDSISDLLPELSDLIKKGGAHSYLFQNQKVEDHTEGKVDSTNRPKTDNDNKSSTKSLVSKDKFLDEI